MSLLSGHDNFKEGRSNLVLGFSSSVILEEGATFGGRVLFEIILVTTGVIVVEVVVLIGNKEVDLVLLFVFLSLNFFPFTMVTLAVVGSIGLGVVVVMVDFVLPVWVGTTGWAKPQPLFFSQKKLCMLDPF